MNKSVWLALIAVIVVTVGAYLFFRQSSDTPVEITDENPPLVTLPEPTTEAPADLSNPETAEIDTEQAPVEDPAITLEESDQLLSEVAETPYFEELVKRGKEHIRNVAAAVDRTVRGQNPLTTLFYLRPPGEFVVAYRDGKIYIAEENYQRYEGMIDAVEAAPAREIAEKYRRFHAAAQSAYDELGNGDYAWDKKLRETVDAVLAVELPTGPIALEGADGVYIYSDPELEDASHLKKILIRMGPAHAAKLQAKLRDVRDELWPPTP